MNLFKLKSDRLLLIFLYLVLSLSIFIYLFTQYIKLGYFLDDTFIYLQYAKNLAHGNGLSFNAGEPSYGVTSPLWAVILSLSFILHINEIWFAKSIDLVSALFSIYFFYKCTEAFLNKKFADSEIIKILKLTATTVFTLNIWFVRWTFTGMETSLAVLGILFIFYNFINSKYSISFILLGFYFLVRPESIVLCLAFILYLLITKCELKKIIKYTVYYLIIIAAIFVFARFYFGTFISNTSLGKTSFNFGIFTSGGQLKIIFGAIGLSSIIEFILSLCLIVYYLLKKKFEKTDILLLSWFYGLILLYLISDSDVISRYLLIIIPFLIIFSIQIFTILKYKHAFLYAYIIMVFAYSGGTYNYFVQPVVNNFEKGFNECFVYIGRWFDSNTQKDCKIILGDVGAMGYYSNRYIIDANALINSDLKLNKNIITTSTEQRAKLTYLLNFVTADYLVQRDTIPNSLKDIKSNKYSLEYLFHREFPGLGVTDQRMKYYTVYKIKYKVIVN